jgi:molybdenum ABC transporter molybdate-binding protein
MTTENPEWMNEWTVGVRLWVERRGEAILGPGRLSLLEAIDRCHSISAAARNLGMSYRRAWLLVDSMNRAAGEELVKRQTGGRDGGGAVLSERGHAAIRVFHELQARVHKAASEPLPDLSSPLSATVHVAAAASLGSVLPCLLAEFAALEPLASVRTICGASDELADQVLNGSHVDLFLSAADGPLDRLESAGLLVPASRTVLGANRLAAITATPHITKLSGPRALLQASVRSLALADPSCPLGHYTHAYLEQLGLWDALRARARFLDNPRVVLAAVECGRADVGLVYRSDASTTRHSRVLFTSRSEQPCIRYTAALTRRGQQSAPARNLLAFLTSPPAYRWLQRYGFSAAPSTRS